MDPLMVRTSVNNAAVVTVELASEGRVNLAINTLYPIPGIPSCMSIDLPPEDVDLVVDALLARKAEALAIRAALAQAEEQSRSELREDTRLKAWQQGRIAWANRNPTCGDAPTAWAWALNNELPDTTHTRALREVYDQGMDELGSEQFAASDPEGMPLVLPSIRLKAVVVSKPGGRVMYYHPDDRLESCPCHGLTWSKYDITVHVNLNRTCPITNLAASKESS